ncbi:hypothetical protein [Aliiroseovarius sp. YM-037]|uniref:hypothetical protein n=1 Tax=Aliiroseovarius sp. YM-037 TaxID=3341728 RepID=UPI003A8098E5
MTYMPLETARLRDRSPAADRIRQFIKTLRRIAPNFQRPPFHLTHHMARDIGLEDSAYPTRSDPAKTEPPRHPML